MRSSRYASVVVLVVALVATLPNHAQCEDDERGNYELGVLTGITWFVADEGVDFTAQVPSAAAGVHAPITPSLRLSIWSDEMPFLFDLGTSLFSSNIVGEELSAINFEFGVGIRRMERARLVPSGGLLLGFVQWSGQTNASDAYVGAQAAVRYFVNGHTSIRSQVGYRHTFNGPRGFDIDSVELALGLGVFL